MVRPVYSNVSASLRALFDKLLAGSLRWPLYLHGPNGTGKTYACRAFLRTKLGGAYFNARELIGDMINKPVLIGPIIEEAPYACLDELGARLSDPSGVAYDAVMWFADKRIDKPTIYVSNRPPMEMKDAYDERVFSRICCGTWYELTGKDRRFER